MRKLFLTLCGAASAWGLFACGGRTLLDVDPFAQPAGASNGGAIGSGGFGAGTGAVSSEAGFTNQGGNGFGFAGSLVAGGAPAAGAPSGGFSAGGAPPSMGGAGAGGAGATGGATTGVCAGAGTRRLSANDAFIDDFECVTNPCVGGTIATGWSTFNDLGAPGADAADNMIKLLQVQPGIMSAHAGEYKGTGANSTLTAPGFGVGAIFNLAIDPAAGIYCVDISAFDGISFWAKTEVDDSEFNVNFVLPNTNAESRNPSTGKENGGDCLTGCYQHPYKVVALERTWQQYTVAFTDTYGGSAKIKKVIQEIGFLTKDTTWDFSLDEIAFYKGTPPAPPLEP